ncbi:hypothetical protein Cgig2_006768 [Carnegiea gigantea]|uniref:CASP-like protein n=1 Tax=Carnegiea gigantea TaxID=171969 RepID=A0A9Q1JLT1_9CARY|nr:hypothetical protein Cgig2_006768 [Carnegiea gigantea]
MEADEDVEADPPQQPPNRSSPDSSSLSSHKRRLPPPMAAPPPSSPPPDSPNSPSSISSDHTFHGYSPHPEDAPSPFRSPTPSPPISTPPTDLPAHSPDLVPVSVPALVPVVGNRLIRDQPEAVTKREPDAETGVAGEGGEGGGGRDGGAGDGGGRGSRPVGRQPLGVVRRARREKIVRRAALGLRVCQFVVCLVSFSVMAADKNRGWALDSFDRYVEFRYSMSVNIIGFAYSGLQGLDLLLQLTNTRKSLSNSQVRCYFDFAMDQILAYLLLSASSSAFTRVDDWISNWGQDKFPSMASASVGVSFLAFTAFALSSLVSGYVLCTHRNSY